jgi:Flp pilus assembly protein TadG
MRLVSKTRSRWASPRRGAAIIEFAVLAPVLVFLLLGTFEVTRGIMVKQVLNDAARRACRTAILPTGTNSAVTADANAVLTDNKLTPSDATITIQVNDVTADLATAKQYDKIAVKISIPASKTTWTTMFYLQANMLESETMTMMRQR